MKLRLKLDAATGRVPTLPPEVELEARLLLPLVALGLRWWRWRSVRRGLLLLHHFPHRRHRSDPEDIARRVNELCEQFWLEARCLESSVLLWHLLRRQGDSAELRFGARLSSARFSAHAWVEQQGEPITGGGVDPTLHYTPMEPQ